MKKKLLIPVLILILCMLFTACQKKAAECAHQFISTAEKEATCQNGGSMKHVCQLCGITYTQTTPVGQHSFTESLAQEATCFQEGILRQTCVYCGSAEEQSIAPIAHTVDMFSLYPSCCVVCGETVEDAANVPENPWYGKNWVALGTSLSSDEKGTYMEPLAERSGMNLTALGIPGGTANANILQLVQTADFSQADLITIEFGVNDWFGNIPLGNAGDTIPYVAEIDEWNNGGTEEGTFSGACYQIFHAIQQKAPQAVIVFLSQSTGQAYPGGDPDCSYSNVNYLGLPQISYTEAAMTTARYMGIPTIDAGTTSMISQYRPAYLADQIHHSELGGQQYALAIWMELKNMAPLLIP